MESQQSAFTLRCTSKESPPAEVVWTKDGVGIPAVGSIYTTQQQLVDGSTATYDSFLSASAAPDDLVGVYSCIVQDSLRHNSEPATITINGE